jgi:hypothetical protein
VFIPNQQKCFVFFIISYVFSLTKSEKKRPGNGGGKVAQTMYTHVSKCKNDKIKGGKNKLTNDKVEKMKGFHCDNSVHEYSAP